MPACFDLEAGGFLRSRAHVGIVAVASADIVYSSVLMRRRRTRGDVRFELASKLPPRLSSAWQFACSRVSVDPRRPTGRRHAELVEFSGGRSTLGPDHQFPRPSLSSAGVRRQRQLFVSDSRPAIDPSPTASIRTTAILASVASTTPSPRIPRQLLQGPQPRARRAHPPCIRRRHLRHRAELRLDLSIGRATAA
jgi:hypothetical protein